jgi:hypothetical protein
MCALVFNGHGLSFPLYTFEFDTGYNLTDSWGQRRVEGEGIDVSDLGCLDVRLPVSSGVVSAFSN